jgi:molybdopterin synthase catalytic subunit
VAEPASPRLVALTAEPIDTAAVLAAVEGPEEGGVVLFLGRVRRSSRGRTVERLDYEAYPPMAEDELAALADEAVFWLGAARVAIVHRTGRLEVGEIAVAIAVAAPHRAQAFAACSWLIDALKERAPIWKKEWYEDGSQWISERP